MSTADVTAGHHHRTGPSTRDVVLQRFKADPAYRVFVLLRIGFVAVPLLMGLDKFFNIMVDWPVYLAPWINDIMPGSASDFMHFVGAVEIIAAVSVALKPRYGAYIVAGWLAGIVINLLTHSGYYDIALRDFALMLTAIALGQLAWKYDPPGFDNLLHR
jgi:hypothetical protein